MLTANSTATQSQRGTRLANDNS